MLDHPGQWPYGLGVRAILPGQGRNETMARFEITELPVAEIQAIAAAFGREMQFDIADRPIGFDLDGLVATDTAISEWIEARGAPTRDGALYVFDGRRTIPRPGKQGRTMTVGDVVHVLVISVGTVAEA